MSEPCEHQKDEAAWIWAQQLGMAVGQRDDALDRLDRVSALHVKDGDFCRDDGFTWPCRTVGAVTDPVE